MGKSLFVWSEDLWNGERGSNGDLSTAKSVFRNKASAEELQTWPFCSLYYEEGTADDNGNTPIAFNNREIDFAGEKLKLYTVRCTKADGGSVDFVYPDPKSVSQDYDLRSAGPAGQVHYIPAGLGQEGDLSTRKGGVTFHVDEAMWMDAGSASDHRDKVKDFLSKKIDEKIASGDSESSSAESEIMASEFSVERVNPTVVNGQEDVHAAETFASEQFRACGCGGASCNCGAESFGADNPEVQDVMIDESSMDTVYPAGDGSIIGQSTYDTDFTPLGSRAEGFVNEGFASEGYYPVGDGRIIGSITSQDQYEPFGYNAEDDEYYAEEGFYPNGDGRVFGDITSTEQFTPLGYNAEDGEGYYPVGDGRIIGSITSENQYEPFGYNAEDMENYEAYDEGITERQEYAIKKLGGRMKNISGMNRSQASDYIKDLKGKNSGTWRADNPMTEDVMIDESSMDTVYPEGDGRIMGQSTYDTDFTPLGSRAEAKPKIYVTGVATAFIVGLLAKMAKNMKKNGGE